MKETKYCSHFDCNTLFTGMPSLQRNYGLLRKSVDLCGEQKERAAATLQNPSKVQAMVLFIGEYINTGY